MKTGFEKTFEVLAATNNEAATKVLVEALDSADREIQSSALRSLVKRRSPQGHAQLLHRWDTLSERHKATIAEQASRLSGALRDAVLSPDAEFADKGLDAVLRLRDFDLVATMLTVAEDRSNPRAEPTARGALRLCELLYEEVSAPRDYKVRRDPQRTRQHVLLALDEAFRRFDQHKRPEILEAFLMLTRPDHPSLKRVLQNPHDKAYVKIINMLSQSTRPGIQELLLSFLDEPQPPSAIPSIIGRRRDVPFVRRLFARFSEKPTKTMKLNARRIENFAWLTDELKILRAVSDEEQSGAVQLVMSAGISRLNAFEVVKVLIENGGPLARREASAQLKEFHGADANRLVVVCLADEDPEVRANVVGQLRERGIPGAMQRLLKLIQSSEVCIQEAARSALSEFSFDRLLTSFELLTEEVAQTTGRLVKLVDLKAIEKLTEELDSPSRTRRLRGISVAIAMGAVPDVEPVLVGMLGDEDHVIRAAVARAMVQSTSSSASQAVRDLLLDRSPSVREAAEETLQTLADAPYPPRLPELQLDEATLNLQQFSRESLP